MNTYEDIPGNNSEIFVEESLHFFNSRGLLWKNSGRLLEGIHHHSKFRKKSQISGAIFVGFIPERNTAGVPRIILKIREGILVNIPSWSFWRNPRKQFWRDSRIKIDKKS